MQKPRGGSAPSVLRHEQGHCSERGAGEGKNTGKLGRSDKVGWLFGSLLDSQNDFEFFPAEDGRRVLSWGSSGTHLGSNQGAVLSSDGGGQSWRPRSIYGASELSRHKERISSTVRNASSVTEVTTSSTVENFISLP